jgi:hypothetical protein
MDRLSNDVDVLVSDFQDRQHRNAPLPPTTIHD